jgi:hypothetical protein
MGMGKNLIIFCFIFSYSMWVFSGFQLRTPALEMVACMQDSSNPLNYTNITGYNITNATLGGSDACQFTIPGVGKATLFDIIKGVLLLLLIGTGISAYIGKFPDPYSWFAGAGIFLLFFMTFPISIINQAGTLMPGEIGFLIGGLFIISYVLSFFEFYKGGSL